MTFRSSLRASAAMAATMLASAALVLSSQMALAQFSQQGPKLVGTGAIAGFNQGQSVSLSSDGNTAIVGGPGDDGGTGAAWVYTRSGGVWTQQGVKLVGTGAIGGAAQGSSVSLSSDGNTAIVGGPSDDGGTGAAWVYTRSGGVWTQQGDKLVGTDAFGALQGSSVSLSSDGNTAIVGGPNNGTFPPLFEGSGAAWVFTRSGGVWTQQGSNLVGTEASGGQQTGFSVSLSSDGNTAIVGGPGDAGTGGAWVFTRSGGVWTQQGSKLVVTGAGGGPRQGVSVSLSSDGNTAIVGGSGAAWVYTRSGGVWTQQGSKLVGTGAFGDAFQGWSVSLSSDGNTAIVGGPFDNSVEFAWVGAAWVFTRSGGVWTQQGGKLVGTGAIGGAQQGISASLSSDGNTAIVGGPSDDSGAGAAWVYTLAPTVTDVSPNSGTTAGGTGVTITGTNFTGATAVDFGGTAATGVTVVGATTITATTPAHASGAVDVVVTTSAGTGTGTAAYTYGAATTTDLVSDINPSVVGQTVTFTATVSSSGGTPTGTVTFKDAGSTIGTGTLSGGTATFSTSALSAGSHAITAAYAGNGSFATSTSAPLTQTVNTYATTTGLGAAPNPSTLGTPVTLTATVESVGGTPTGTITFKDGAATLGTRTLAGGTASLSTSSLTVGTHTLTAVYGGDASFAASTSSGVTQTVNSGALQVTPPTDIVATGNLNGPIEPSSFAYSLSTSSGSTSFAISGVPSWLTASATSGTATTSGAPVTFTVNASASLLPAGTYPATISFTNTTNGAGDQTRTATLTVRQCSSRLGDLNGDARSDIVFRRTDGLLSVYLMNGFQIVSAAIVGAIGTEWTLVGIGDFNGDGQADLLFRRTDGALAIYLMNGGNILAAQIIGTVGTEWNVVGVGDFNGDGRADFMTRRTSDGMLAIYLMNGFQFLAAQLIGSVGTEWKIQGVADFNGDGKADLLFRRTSDGTLAVYLMNGFLIESAAIVGAIGTDWTVVGVGDFNGDGKADFLTRHTNGTLGMYLMNGTQLVAAQVIGVVGTEWSVAGIGDLNGDARADLLFHRTSGQLSAYLMNGFQVLAAQIIGALGTEWNSCYGQGN